MSRAQGINTDFEQGSWSYDLQWSGRTFQCAAMHSIRALLMSIWDVVPSSSVWPQLSSVKQSSDVSSIILRFRLTRRVILGSIVYYLVLQVVIWMGIDTDLSETAVCRSLLPSSSLFPYWKGKYFNKPAKRGGK